MSTMLSEPDWNRILDNIAKGRLTPIIGKEMYTYKNQKDLVPIEEYISQQILADANVTDKKFTSLADLVKFLENDLKYKEHDIQDKLKFLFDDDNPDMIDFTSFPL